MCGSNAHGENDDYRIHATLGEELASCSDPRWEFRLEVRSERVCLQSSPGARAKEKLQETTIW